MRLPSRQCAVAVALVTPLLLLGVNACSDDAAPASSGTTPTETATEPTDEPTGTSTETPDGTEVADPARIFDQMQEAMRAAKTARVAMDIGVGTASGVLAYGAGEPELALTMDMSSAGGAMGDVEMRYVGGVMYMSMPPLTRPGKFFKIDPSNKTLGSIVEPLKSLTPEAATEMIAKSLKKMTDVGDEKIGKDETTHYVVVVDTKASMELLDQMDVPGGAASPTLPATLTYDMWVTKDHLMRRVLMSTDTFSTQVDYTDWGKPVKVAAPAPADIVKLPPGF